MTATQLLERAAPVTLDDGLAPLAKALNAIGGVIPTDTVEAYMRDVRANSPDNKPIKVLTLWVSITGKAEGETRETTVPVDWQDRGLDPNSGAFLLNDRAMIVPSDGMAKVDALRDAVEGPLRFGVMAYGYDPILYVEPLVPEDCGCCWATGTRYYIHAWDEPGL